MSIFFSIIQSLGSNKNSEDWRKLGNEYFGAGLISEAEACYARAIQIDAPLVSIVLSNRAQYG